MTEEILDGAIVDWLEELPLDELPSDYTRMIVNDFRQGHMCVTEAISLLCEDCKEELSDHIRTNIELETLLR
jgi:hypothetical protein